MGPRQLELPPKSPVAGLGGLVVHPVLHPVHLDARRDARGGTATARGCRAGERNSCLVQHVAEHARQLGLGHHREEPPDLAVRAVRLDDVIGEIRPVVDEPLHAPLEPGQAIDLLGLERLDREQRDQPHHGAHAERQRAHGPRAWSTS